MNIRKYTEGYVCQTFDTESGKCLRQDFIVDDMSQVEYIDEKDKSVEVTKEIMKLYHPFTMEQP